MLYAGLQGVKCSLLLNHWRNNEEKERKGGFFAQVLFSSQSLSNFVLLNYESCILRNKNAN